MMLCYSEVARKKITENSAPSRIKNLKVLNYGTPEPSSR